MRKMTIRGIFLAGALMLSGAVAATPYAYAGGNSCPIGKDPDHVALIQAKNRAFAQLQLAKDDLKLEARKKGQADVDAEFKAKVASLEQRLQSAKSPARVAQLEQEIAGLTVREKTFWDGVQEKIKKLVDTEGYWRNVNATGCRGGIRG